MTRPFTKKLSLVLMIAIIYCQQSFVTPYSYPLVDTSAYLTGKMTRIGGYVGAKMGKNINSAGDFNHDGYEDIMISAYIGDGTGSSAVYVLYGGPNAFQQ